MRRFLHAFLLVFAFLLAQAGMAAHAAGHVGQAGHDNGYAAESACELCVGYAQLGGGALAPAEIPLLLCRARHQVPLGVPVSDIPGVAFRARARAPPLFP